MSEVDVCSKISEAAAKCVRLRPTDWEFPNEIDRGIHPIPMVTANAFEEYLLLSNELDDRS